jgi:hypothetical protein
MPAFIAAALTLRPFVRSFMNRWYCRSVIMGSRKAPSCPRRTNAHQASDTCRSLIVVTSKSDRRSTLKRVIMETLPEARWQRCYVRFLRNALDYLPRKQTDDCLTELRWLYDRHTAEEARRDLAQWLARWQDRHPKLCGWVEANIDENFAFYRLPREYHKHLKSKKHARAAKPGDQTPHAARKHLP